MINLFKKDSNLYAPANGILKDITECDDSVFSKKMIGDGYFIEPIEGKIYSPCSGTVESVFPTKHAFGFKLANGAEVILHIGLDTVKLEGGILKSQIKEGSKIKKGDLLVTYDPEETKRLNVKMPVIVVVLDGKTEHIKSGLGKEIKQGDLVIEMGD